MNWKLDTIFKKKKKIILTWCTVHVNFTTHNIPSCILLLPSFIVYRRLLLSSLLSIPFLFSFLFFHLVLKLCATSQTRSDLQYPFLASNFVWNRSTTKRFNKQINHTTEMNDLLTTLKVNKAANRFKAPTAAKRFRAEVKQHGKRKSKKKQTHKKRSSFCMHLLTLNLFLAIY